jgi:putative oxidoreductase
LRSNYTRGTFEMRERDSTLELCLLLLRLTTAVFLLMWSVDKIVNVKHAQAVYATFYFWKDAAPQILMAIGIAQTALILAFAAGFMRFWTYGAILLMHSVTIVASLGKMIPPYAPTAALTFWAGVPVLAGMFALFMLRDRDRMATIGN